MLRSIEENPKAQSLFPSHLLIWEFSLTYRFELALIINKLSGANTEMRRDVCLRQFLHSISIDLYFNYKRSAEMRFLNSREKSAKFSRQHIVQQFASVTLDSCFLWSDDKREMIWLCPRTEARTLVTLVATVSARLGQAMFTMKSAPIGTCAWFHHDVAVLDSLRQRSLTAGEYAGWFERGRACWIFWQRASMLGGLT